MGQMGIGAMLGYLGGNEQTVKAVLASVWKTIKEARVEDNTLALIFDDGSVLKFHDDGQSCCESRYMNCDDDLSNVVGHKFVSAELLDGDGPYVEYGEHEIQFLRIITDKGDFRVSNHNEHNGYYGGFSIKAAFHV